MLLLSLLSCDALLGPVIKQSGYSHPFTLPATLQVGTLGPDGAVTWAPLDTSGDFEGVVVASWCPTCERLLTARAADPDLRDATSNLFFLAEEVDLQLDASVRAGRMTREQADATRREATGDRSLLLHPERLAGTNARAVHWNDVPAQWFPFFFTCEDGVCEGWSGTW